MKIRLILSMIFIVLIHNINAATYYSRSSNNWTNRNTWSLSSGGNKVGNGVYPATGDIVIIEGSDNVTINTAAVCTSIQIGATGSGTLTFNSGTSLTTSSLTLGNTNNSGGTLNMSNGGTLIMNGALATAGIGTKTWTPGTGTVVMNETNTLPASIFNTFNNLSITGGTTTLTATTTVNGNLAISNSGSTLNCDAYQLTGNSTGTFAMGSGTFLLLGKASGSPYNNITFPTNYSTANTSLNSTSTVSYLSPTYQTIPVFTYGNLTLSSISGNNKVATNDFTINGDLTVNTNTTFQLGWDLNTLSIGGQLIDNGVFEFNKYSGQTVTISGNLSGSGTLKMTGGTHTLNLNGLNNSISTFTTDATASTVNYGYSGVGTQQVFTSPNYNSLSITGGSAKLLSGNITLSNNLNLSSGILATSTYVLSISNSASTAITGGSSTSYINGPIKWTLPASLASGSTYNFPVGTSSSYLPFSLVNPTTGTGTVTAQVSATSADPGGTLDASLISKSATEYWTLATVGNFTNSSVSITRPSAISPYNVVSGSTTTTGTYSNLAGTAGTYGVTSSNTIGTNRSFVLAQASNAKQFRSLTSGNWNATGTWQQSTNGGTTWTAATTTPTSSDAQVTIQAGHTVSLTANATVSNLAINGTLTESTYSLTGTGTLSVASTGVLNIGGTNNFPTGFTSSTLNSSSTVNYNASANQTIADLNYGIITLSGSGTKTLTSATARTSNVLTVNSGVTLALSGSNSFTPSSATVNGDIVVSNTATLIKGSGSIAFNAGSTYNHNRNAGILPIATWASTSTCLVSGVTTTVPTVTSFAQTFGNVTWNATAQTADISLSGQIASITGNFNMMSSGTGSLRFLNAAAGLVPITIGGNLTQSGGTLYGLGTSTTQIGGNLLLTVNGNYSMSGGIFIPNGNPSDGTSACTMNVQGNFNITAGTISEPSPGASNINFTGTSTQTYVKTGGVFTNTINFGINTGSTVDFGSYVLDGSNGTFNLLTGGTIITANTAGLAASGATGTIQSTGTRTYSATANYIYNGTTAQITGTGLTAANNLTINNSAGITLSAASNVSGILYMTSGKLITTSNLLSISNTATTAIVGASATAYIDGPLKRSLPASLVSGSSYNFPVGNGSNYLPFIMVNPTTSTGSPTAQVTAYTSNSNGVPDATLDSISRTGYWILTPTANITNTSVSIARSTAISPLNTIAASTSLAGTYNAYDGTVGTSAISNSNTITIGSTTNRYFAFAKRKSGISVSTNTLSAFTYKENLGPSTIQSFTVNGYGLSNNIKLEMLRGNFEISTTNAPSFSGSGVIYLPVVNGVVSSTTIYIRLKAGLAQKALYTDSITVSSTGISSEIINCNGSVTAGAAITATSTVSVGSYNFGAGPTVGQPFTVSGILLNGAVTITPPSDFQIATSLNGTYQSTAIIVNPGATMASTTYYVRMISGLGVGNHTQNIVVSSTGAVSKNVECSGNVNAGARLTTSTSFLGAFLYNEGTTTANSVAQKFKFSGTNLTNNIVLTSTNATRFIISKTLNGTYGTTLTYTATGNYTDSVYVKMIGGLSAGNYGPIGITLTSTGAITKSVACTGTVVATSTAGIATSTNSLSGFGYQYKAGTPTGVYGGGPSTPQPFVVSGVTLTNDITITAPTNFEVSLSATGTYTSSLILARSSSNIAPTTVYVRLLSGKPVGTYSGTVALNSGSLTASITIDAAKVYSSPLITVGPSRDYCTGSTIALTSNGTDISSQYWVGPNNYYSTAPSPTVSTNATSAMAGNYVVTGNVVIGGNLIYNGDFEQGNVGFGSAYGYPNTPFTTSSLVPEGLYAITTTGSTVHNNFNTVADHSNPGTLQMIINGNINAGAVVWTQNVAVVKNANYQFTYWLQTVVNGIDPAPSKLQLYINGVAAGALYTANPASGNWTQYIYNTNAGESTTLNLELVNQTTAAGGNDFSLDDIEFKQVLSAQGTTSIAVGPSAPVSVTLVASQNPVNSGVPVTYTATPTNGGTNPTYAWYVNNVLVSGATGPQYTYAPSNGDQIKCVLTSSLYCVTGNPATSSTIAMVVNTVITPNYWFGAVSTDWGNPANWTRNEVPIAGDDVEYATVANYGSTAVKDLYVDTTRVIGSLINATTKRLVILAGRNLTVNNTITTNNDVNTIFIQSSATEPTGTLIYHNAFNYPVYATVEMYSPASWDLTRPVNQKYNWQYFGIPLRSLVAVPTLSGSYVRKYLETGTTIENHWQKLDDGSQLEPFIAYEICQLAPKKYTFKGQLVNQDYNSGQLAKTLTGIYPGQHILSNPYTAGIDIRQITFGSDMESTVYMYHTGTFASWSSSLNGKVGENTGQYISVPQANAGYALIPRQVPSMSSMLIRIKTTVPTSTVNSYVNLNYNSLVMKNADLVRAPAQNKKVAEPVVSTRIELKGKNSSDVMWIFSKDSCNRHFDNGEDGLKILGNALQPQIYAIEPDGNYQIDAVQDMNNTFIAFQAGQDSVYEMIFNHENSETKYAKIYLIDYVTNAVVDVTENLSTYTFSAETTQSAVNRFKIVTKSIIDNPIKSNVNIFAADEKILIQNFSDYNGNYYIYDLMGRILDKNTLDQNNIIAIPAKPFYTYIVKVVVNGEVITEKVVIR